jgi:hypothetical protein
MPRTLDQLQSLLARADAYADAVYARAVAACRAAGLPVSHIGIMPHNALVARAAGDPWLFVDYAEVERCVALLDRQWAARRLVHAWYERHCREICASMGETV